jgi:hypothetical protein
LGVSLNNVTRAALLRRSFHWPSTLVWRYGIAIGLRDASPGERRSSYLCRKPLPCNEVGAMPWRCRFLIFSQGSRLVMACSGCAKRMAITANMYRRPSRNFPTDRTVDRMETIPLKPGKLVWKNIYQSTTYEGGLFHHPGRRNRHDH